MDQRRVLIVESQNEFALSLAAVLRNQGYATALAQNAAEANREVEKRRPDLVVLRAELPDMSGFSLCGNLKKLREPVQVILMSSDASDAFAQHQSGPTPADGYLAIPFAMEELSAVVDKLMLETAPNLGSEDDPGDDLDKSFDQSLGLAPPPAPAEQPAGDAPTPMPKGPPKLPKRERRSALTDDDRQFLERVFGSIADRKAELLAEAKSSKRPPPRRELLASPEGKLQLLREEVKTRESQIARLSEIWSARERELLSVEDRLHDKDVEVQGLKMQIDDLLRRFNEAQEAFLQKEKEHGATVDDLLLQRFSSEKDLIEVVAAKEKDLNALRRELNHRDDELARRAVELETAHQQYAQLEKQSQLDTLQGEMREGGLRFTLDKRETEIELLRGDVDFLVREVLDVQAEREARVNALARDLRDYETELATIQTALGSAVQNLMARAEEAERKLPLLEEALIAERAERVAAEAAWREALDEAEGELFETDILAQDLRVQRDGVAQVSQQRIEERQAEIDRLTKELADKIRQADAREAELNNELSQKLERVVELEGEAEALKAHLDERERELNHQVTQLITDLEATQSDLEQTRSDLSNTQDAKRANEEKLNGEIAGHLQKIADVEQQVVHTREQGEKALAEEQHRAADELAAFKDAAQQRYSEREADLQGQIDTHLAEQTRLREQIGNLEGELAALQQSRTELEQQLSTERTHVAEITAELEKEREDRHAAEAALREQVGNLDGQLEALRTDKADVDKQLADTQTHATELQGQLNDLTEEKAKVDASLAGTQATLVETTGNLQAEQSAHAQLQEEHAALQDAHKSLQTEFGEREGHSSRLQAEFASTEANLHAAEEKLVAQAEEQRRQLELVSKDLQAHKQALADTKGKLTATAQEKTRRETELKLELERKNEALKSMETQVQITKEQGDNRLADSEKKRTELEAALSQTREQAKKVTATAQELQKRLEVANASLENARKDAANSAAQRDQKLGDAASQLNKEKDVRRKLEEDLANLRAQAEQRLKDAQQKIEQARAEAAQKDQVAQQQLAQRAKKVQEMEAALEASQAAKAKAERDLAAKAGSSESREKELTTKLQQAVRILKEQEAKTAAAVDDANNKAKAEIDRRDAARSTEIQRLQQSLQEKSKALKVAELEVQRLKAKADAPGTARPATSARPPTSGTPAVKPATAAAAPKAVPPPSARPPSDFEATSMMNRSNLLNMIKEEQQQAGGKPGVAKPMPHAPPNPSPMEEAVERTVVMRAPTAPAAPAEPPEDDWTSVVDSLDK